MFTPELIFGNALDYFLLYLNILISFSFHRSTLHWCHWLPGRSVCRLHCTTILKSDSFRLNFHLTPPSCTFNFTIQNDPMNCCCATLLSANICSVLKQPDPPFSSVSFSKSWDLYLKSTVYLKDNFHNYEMSTMANVVQCIECKKLLVVLFGSVVVFMNKKASRFKRNITRIANAFQYQHPLIVRSL